MAHFWKIVEMKTAIHVPKYLKNILALNGYDDASSIQSITTEDIDLFEEFVKNEIDCFIGTNDDPKDFYGHTFYNKKDKFKIMKGDRVKLMQVVEFAKINLALSGHHFFINSKQISHSTSKNRPCSQEFADENLENNRPIQIEYNLAKSTFDVTANADDQDVIVTSRTTKRNRVTSFPHKVNSDDKKRNRFALENAVIKVERDIENVDHSTEDREIEPQVQSLNSPKVKSERANDIHVNPNGNGTLTPAQSDVVVDKMKRTYQLRVSKETINVKDERTEHFTAATKIELHPETVDGREFILDKKMQKDENSAKNNFCCDICRKEFSLNGSLKKHMLIHTDVKEHTCTFCERSFRTRANLQSHLLTHTGEKPFACNVCSKVFRYSSNLSQHKMTHPAENSAKNNFSCDICGKEFLLKKYIKAHMSIHTDVKEHTCTFCERSFRTRANLQSHLLTHTGEKTFACDVCSKVFRYSSNLSQHKRTHPAENSAKNNFSCDICGMEFGLKPKLKIHMSIHTDVKEHTCKVCERSFRTRANLQSHLLIHTGEKPFACDVCSKVFRHSKSLSYHKRTHSAVKSFS